MSNPSINPINWLLFSTQKGLHSHNGRLIGVSSNGLIRTWRVDQLLKATENNNNQFKNGDPKVFLCRSAMYFI